MCATFHTASPRPRPPCMLLVHNFLEMNALVPWLQPRRWHDNFLCLGNSWLEKQIRPDIPDVCKNCSFIEEERSATNGIRSISFRKRASDSQEGREIKTRLKKNQREKMKRTTLFKQICNFRDARSELFQYSRWFYSFVFFLRGNWK